jgi:hypothetical protein
MALRMLASCSTNPRRKKNETSDVQSSQVGDGGEKKKHMKFPSFDETKMPTEAAEEHVVEIEALGTATLRRD